MAKKKRIHNLPPENVRQPGFDLPTIEPMGEGGLLMEKRTLLKPIKPAVPADEEQDEGETRGAPPRLHKEEHGGPRLPAEDITEMQRRSTRGSGPMSGAEINAGYRSLGKVNLLGDD